ncbi:MAG: hypothetical protein II892_01535 [Fibrobacter sp.]|nr:hypothetical protein [Fibrobacter sp.]
MKKVWSFLSLLSLTLVACTGSGSTTPSSEIDVDRFIVTDMMAYEFTDSSLIQIQGQCEEEHGELVWSMNGKQYQSPASLNKSTDSLRIVFSDGVVRFAYEGDSFPIGLFRSTEPDKNIGVIFEKNGTMQYLVYYKNECLIDELNMTIKPEDKRIDCNTVLRGDGSYMKVLPPEGAIFKFEFSAGNVTCSAETRTLFPYYEQDCKDAYSKFQKDTSSTKVFDFKEYRTKTTLDSNCFKDLAVELAAPQQH